MAGNCGEVSNPWHQLLAALPSYRVRVTGVQYSRGGIVRSVDVDYAMTISCLRGRVGVATVRAQCTSMLGRLKVLGPGAAAVKVGSRT